MRFLFTFGTAILLGVTSALATTPPAAVVELVRENCLECHDADTSEGKLDLTALTFDLAEPKLLERWVQLFDRLGSPALDDSTRRRSVGKKVLADGIGPSSSVRDRPRQF